MTPTHTDDSRYVIVYRAAGIGALLAMAANLLDVILGFGESDVVVYGTQSAVDWFNLFQASGFKGLYQLGLFNIVYMLCMIPVYAGMLVAHRRTHLITSALASILFLLAVAIYMASSASIPMYVLAHKYALATTEAQRALIAAAGEAVLARGEDFTPGSFPGLLLSGVAAIMLSWVMLCGKIFGKVNAWMGLVGFTLLSLFTITATFVQELYRVAFYGFGMFGGVMALTWFVLTARRFFRLARTDA